jgi:hypothetical protein
MIPALRYLVKAFYRLKQPMSVLLSTSARQTDKHSTLVSDARASYSFLSNLPNLLGEICILDVCIP